MSFDAQPHLQYLSSKVHWWLKAIAALLLAAVLAGCQSSGDESAFESAPPVVEVRALDYAFVAPDTIRSGWTTLEMTNEGEEHHLFLLAKLPGNKTFSALKENVYGPIDSLMSQLKAGTIDTATYRKTLPRTIPEWYLNQTEFLGGVSLTAPGRTAQTTVNLEPGTYAMECYAKTPGGRLHAVRGMLRPLVVTTDSTSAEPPEADLSVALTKLQIQTDRIVSPGRHTIAVRFGEKRKGGALGYFVQHLHLARLDGETTPRDLVRWMELQPVMPAPVEFLGGPQGMPTGHTAYMNVDLTPGRYAWVLGNPPEQGAVTPFTVE